MHFGARFNITGPYTQRCKRDKKWKLYSVFAVLTAKPGSKNVKSSQGRSVNNLMPAKSLPETFFHLECLSDARLLVPWKVTDEDWKARDQLIASVSDWREAQGMWGPGGEEEQGHSPVVTTLAGDGCCVPLPPESAVFLCHPTEWHELFSDALRSSISLPPWPQQAAARPQWSMGYQWPGHQQLKEEQRGYKTSFPPWAQSREPGCQVPCASPKWHFQPSPREMQLSPCQELLCQDVPETWKELEMFDPVNEGWLIGLLSIRWPRKKLGCLNLMFKLEVTAQQWFKPAASLVCSPAQEESFSRSRTLQLLEPKGWWGYSRRWMFWL